MLPRLKWWFSDNTKAVAKAWYRVNNHVATYVLKKGGVTSVTRTLLGTVFSLEMMAHTSQILGRIFFISTVQGGLEQFLTEPNVHVFP